MVGNVPHPAMLMQAFVMKVKAYARAIPADGNETKLLSQAFKLQGEWARALEPLADYHTDQCFVAKACSLAHGQLTSCLDVAGIAWLQQTAAAQPDADLEALALEVLGQPTPKIRDAVITMKLKKEIASLEETKVGNTFADLAEIMPLYTKVSCVKVELLDEATAAACAAFGSAVDASMSEACAAFQEAVQQLCALAEKYE